MKKTKRNVAIIVVLLFVCAAVYFNWSYNAQCASQETIDSAMRAISAMASDSMTETQIENLLLAKNFSECVVYITEDGITVAVPAPADGLSTAQVATITDAIVGETDYTAPQIKVIEVKADAQ